MTRETHLFAVTRKANRNEVAERVTAYGYRIVGHDIKFDMPDGTVKTLHDCVRLDVLALQE